LAGGLTAAAEPAAEPGAAPATEASSEPAAEPASGQAAGEPAGAATSAPEPAPVLTTFRRAKLGISAGLKGSLGLPQPFSTLKTGGGLELELGYLLPFIGRRLGLSVAMAYGHHTATGQDEDPRLTPTGTYNWDLTFQAMMISMAITGRIFPPYAKLMNGYLSVGPRIFLLSMKEKAYSQDQNFGTTTEKDTRVGVFVVAGGEYYLGPGALFLELEYSFVKVPGLIPGEGDGSSLRFALGYRILL
jgi:hypothetical protein